MKCTPAIAEQSYRLEKIVDTGRLRLDREVIDATLDGAGEKSNASPISTMLVRAVRDEQ